jgi:hypothetical protein
MPAVQKYGLRWPEGARDIDIEMAMIRAGGYVEVGGKKLGNGLAFHYGAMRRIIWPHLDEHRWHKLCLQEIRRPGAKVTVLMGPGSSGKTHEAAWNYLCEYYCFPEETCVLVSSTDMRGLELRVWGEIKMLHERATERFPELPGQLVESRRAITTDDIDDDGTRDFRRGIIGVPTVQGGKNVGLGKFVGIKQKRMRLIADEAQFMSSSFLSAFANLDKNEDFQAVILGNPVDMLDPLGRAAEPVDGWERHMEPEKTEVWDTRFLGGRCVNLVGTDSPNFDYPHNEPTRYPYLISREKIERTATFFDRNSPEFYSQCKGVMKVGQIARSVVTRLMCEQFDAFSQPVWDGASETVRVAGLDASYGGDRCVLTDAEFGRTVDGRVAFAVRNQLIVPISVSGDEIVEDAIARYCMEYCLREGIPPQNFFHDSTGRGTLGTSLARIWSPACNPVEFGGQPTNRPVATGLDIVDEQTGIKRPKLCREHYSKFVTELWFSVRYTIESGQFKGMPADALDEGSRRQWEFTRGNLIEVEPKHKMKKRVGFSPDLFDSLCIALEGARRRGFVISKVGGENPQAKRAKAWFHRESEKYAKAAKRRVLQCA